jgi:hypothetical protein
MEISEEALAPAAITEMRSLSGKNSEPELLYRSNFHSLPGFAPAI